MSGLNCRPDGSQEISDASVAPWIGIVAIG
jgi:hypothetical protein